MPKRGENIRKRRDGRWEGRYICGRDINGKAKYHSIYANTYTEVRTRLTEAKGKPATKQQNNATKTFGVVAEQWLDSCSLRLKHSTIVKYSTLLNNHILPYFSHMCISMISDDLITQFIKGKSSELSSSMVRSLLTTIKSVLKCAKKQGWYSNPPIELRLPSVQKKEISALSNTDRQKLEDFLLTDMDSSKLGLFLCLYTGLRIGELCALRWGDIDLKKKTLHITSTIQRIKQSSDLKQKTTLLISTPKSTTSIRDIPLPLQLVDLLEIYSQNDNCFLLSGTTVPIEPRTMQYRFCRHATQLGLAYTNPHVLRHTFATRCIEFGFDPKTLSELLGHSSVEITLNRYVHSSDDRKREQMARLFDEGQNSGQN